MNSKKLLILGIIGASLLLAAAWLNGHSFLEITVTNPAKGELLYVLSDKNGENVANIESSSATVKRLVANDDFEVMVTQGDTTAFSIVKTKGFLGTTKVTVELQQEKSRAFVGDNPGFCMHYNQAVSTLFSYNCSGTFTDLSVHTRATASEPTYTINPEAPEFDVKGVIEVGGVSYVHMENVQAEEGAMPVKSIYKLKPDLALNEWVELPDLNRDKIYSIKNYLQGFIAYDDSFDEIKYYGGIGAKATNVPTEKPANEKLLPVNLSVHGAYVGVLYAEETDHTDEDLDEESVANTEKPAKGASEVIVYNDTSAQHFKFNTIYSSVLLCGDQKLCLLSGSYVDVYDISGDKPKKRFSVSGVEAMEMSGNTLLLARTSEVLGLDVETKTGAVQYSYENYAFCGMQASGSGYMLCVVDIESGDSRALFVQPGTPDSDSIDKKVAELQTLPEVEKVSAYGNYIHVSPNAGERIYRADIRGYGFDPAVLQAANKAINRKIQELGIDRGKYTIVNPYQ